MATRNRPIAGKAWISLFLVGFLVLVLDTVSKNSGGVEAFQSNAFGIVRQQYLDDTLRNSFTASRSTDICVPFLAANHESCKSNLLGRRSMVTDSTSESSSPARESKRKKFRESVKKMISYPKVRVGICTSAYYISNKRYNGLNRSQRY